MRKLPLFAIAFALVAGCAAQDAPSDANDETPTPGVMVVSGSESPRPTEFTTAILEGGAYQHPRLEVAAQTTIIWWNVDDEAHSVVSDDGQFAGSGPIPPSGEFMRTFQTPGEYRFHCRYHPDMTGVVIVT